MARILVIEDNEMNRELVKFLFESAGHQCEIATDGESGIKLAQTASPDVVLLDIQLPKMDGYSVLKQLQSMGTEQLPPIIAVSSYAMVGDRERALSAGFNGYISKPINPQTFVHDVLATAGLAG
ncbi:MAG TPA: response regulator [Candidatus Obscuribacterales bacterium]